MSALQEQVRRIEGARYRLGVTQARPRVRTDLIKRKKAAAPAKEEFAPFVNMLGGPSWRRLVALVAMKHGVMPGEILGQSRMVHICAARHEAVWLCYTHLPTMTLHKVAFLFNRSDHSAIINSLERMRRKLGIAA